MTSPIENGISLSEVALLLGAVGKHKNTIELLQARYNTEDNALAAAVLHECYEAIEKLAPGAAKKSSNENTAITLKENSRMNVNQAPSIFAENTKKAKEASEHPAVGTRYHR